MLYLFLLFIAVVLILGMIPSLVSEDKIHNLIEKWYLYEKTNLDIIHEELHKKQNLVQKTINDGSPVTNSHSIYYFTVPVTITFNINSTYMSGKIRKRFYHVDTLTIFALHGDIECKVECGMDSKSVFIFEDTHKVNLLIEPEEVDSEWNLL